MNNEKIKYINDSFTSDGYTYALKYLKSMTTHEQYKWLKQFCMIFKSDPDIKISNIQFLRQEIEKRINSLREERDGRLSNVDISRSNIKWITKFIDDSSDSDFQMTINSLSPLIQTPADWIDAEDKIFKLTDKTEMSFELGVKQNQLINYFVGIHEQLVVLEDIYPSRVNICEILENELPIIDTDGGSEIDKQLSTAEGRIKFIESIYQKGLRYEKKMTWEIALNKANKIAGRDLYTTTTSFHTARGRWIKRSRSTN